MSASRAGWAPLTLPVLLPDETLYNWASRYHRRSGNALADATSAQLFGRRRAGAAHDLPCAIDTLVERTEGLLGGAEALIRERTLLPFYLPLQTIDVQRLAIDTLRGPRLGHLKFRLGMLTSRFGAHHPLKACPTCAEEDQAGHHEALWRRSHQWPGVWVCARHGRWLVAAKSKVRGIARFQWVLPDATDFHSYPKAPPGEMFYSLAAVVRGWCSLPPFFSFDSARLAATHRRAVADRVGLRGGSLNFKALVCIPTERDRGFRRMMTAESDDVDR